jgi:protein TonB
LRSPFARRLCGAAGALAIEGLLLLALLSLGAVEPLRKIVPLAIDSFDVRNETQEPPRPEKAERKPAEKRATTQMPQTVAQPAPQPSEAAPRQPATVVLQPMPSFDLAKIPRAPAAAPRAGPMIGPADTPRFGDSERVGTAPNGAPMYAARWYREPTDQELRGYLSTAQGPAWGLITCKTVPDFRVEDCVGLDEYPEGSRMLPAILAAAWQFRVRPPQIGGVSQVGDWVRIRIDYDYKPAGSSYGAAR